VEAEIAAAGAPLHRVVLAVPGAELLLLAEELPGHPGDVAGIAVVAVEVRVLTEEGVGALRSGQAPHAAETWHVEKGIIGFGRIDVAVGEAAHALQVEGLDDGVKGALRLVALLGLPDRLWLVVKPADIAQRPHV